MEPLWHLLWGEDNLRCGQGADRSDGDAQVRVQAADAAVVDTAQGADGQAGGVGQA